MRCSTSSSAGRLSQDMPSGDTAGIAQLGHLHARADQALRAHKRTLHQQYHGISWSGKVATRPVVHCCCRLVYPQHPSKSRTTDTRPPMSGDMATSNDLPPAEQLYEANVGQTARFLQAHAANGPPTTHQPHVLPPVLEADSTTLSSSAHASHTAPSQPGRSITERSTSLEHPPAVQAPQPHFPNPKAGQNPLPPDPELYRRSSSIHAPAADPLDLFAPSEEFATATAADDINALLPPELTMWNHPTLHAAPLSNAQGSTELKGGAAAPGASIFSSSRRSPAPAPPQPPAAVATPQPDSGPARPPLEATTEALRVAGAAEASGKVIRVQEPLTASLRSKNRSGDRNRAPAAAAAFVPQDAAQPAAAQPAAAPPVSESPRSATTPAAPAAAATFPYGMHAPAPMYAGARQPHAPQLTKAPQPPPGIFSSTPTPLPQYDADFGAPVPAAVAPPQRTAAEILQMFPPRIRAASPKSDPAHPAGSTPRAAGTPRSHDSQTSPQHTFAPAPGAHGATGSGRNEPHSLLPQPPAVPWYSSGGGGATEVAAFAPAPAGSTSPGASMSLRDESHQVGGMPALTRNGTAGSGTKASLQFDVLPVPEEVSETAEMLAMGSVRPSCLAPRRCVARVSAPGHRPPPSAVVDLASVPALLSRDLPQQSMRWPVVQRCRPTCAATSTCPQAEHCQRAQA